MARQDVEVQVEHLLPCGTPVRGPDVEPVGAARGHDGRRQRGAHREEPAREIGRAVGEVHHVAPRHDEGMPRVHREQVEEGGDIVALVDETAGNASAQDLAEEAVGQDVRSSVSSTRPMSSSLLKQCGDSRTTPSRSAQTTPAAASRVNAAVGSRGRSPMMAES